MTTNNAAQTIDFSVYSRDPDDYVLTDHIKDDVLPAEKRHLTIGIVYTTISHGDIQAAHGNAEVEFYHQWDGVGVYVLAGYDKDNEWPVAITAWPALEDGPKAMESDMWREDQLRQIAEFNDTDFDDHF